jgi:hypothetical protein
MTRVPTARPPTPPERRRNEPPGMLAVRKTRTFPEGLQAEAARDQGPSIGKRLRACARRGPPASVPSSPRLTVNVLAKWTEDSLIAGG